MATLNDLLLGTYAARISDDRGRVTVVQTLRRPGRGGSGAPAQLVGAAGDVAAASGGLTTQIRMVGNAADSASASGVLTVGSISTLGVVSLKSDAPGTGTQIHTFGVTFEKGVAPSVALNIPSSDYQVDVRATHFDGSVRHAVFTVIRTFNFGEWQQFEITSGSPPAAGTPLTMADVPSAVKAGEYSIDVPGVGKATFNLNATPFFTQPWFSGSKMSEFLFRVPIGTMAAWLQVRVHAGGRCAVRLYVDNDGYFNNGSVAFGLGTHRSYIPTYRVNGSVIYGPASPVNHRAHYCLTTPGANWTWINADGTLANADPQITPDYSGAIETLIDSQYMPNHGRGYRSPTSAAFGPLTGDYTGLVQTYTPSDPGFCNPWMGNTGFGGFIGPVPNHEALFLTSGGDIRAYKATLAAAATYNNFPITFRDQTTNRVPKPSSFATWTYQGPGGGGANEYPPVGGPPGDTNVQNYFEFAHHPSCALAYILTGDYFHYEVMQKVAFMCWMLQSNGMGSGTNRIALAQVRAAAWTMRTWGQLVALAPDFDKGPGSIVADFATLLQTNAAWHVGKLTDGTNRAKLGMSFWSGGAVTDYGQWGAQSGASAGTIAGWMGDYLNGALGYVRAMEPLSNMSTWVQWHTLASTWTISRFGVPGNTSKYGFHWACNYGIKIAADNTQAAADNWYPDWGTVFTNSVGTPNSTVSNTLQGGGGASLTTFDIPRGYWANALAALAYAMDFEIPGAAEAWARLTDASNFDQLASGFNDIPVLNVRPRDPKWMKSIPLSTWTEMVGVNINAVQTYAPVDPLNSFGSPPSDVKAGVVVWSGGAVCGTDIDHGAGGGHTNCADNAFFRLKLHAKALTWALVLAPTPKANVQENVLHYSPDNYPTSRHSYFEPYYVEVRNRYMLIGCGSGYGGNPANSWEVDGFERTIGKWDNTSGGQSVAYQNGSVVGFSHQTGMSKCQDLAGNVYNIVNNNALIKWTAATAGWSNVGGSTFFNDSADDSGPMAYDHTRNRMLACGRGRNRLYTLSGSAFTESTPALSGADAGKITAGCTLDFVGYLDKYVGWTEDPADQNVYAINASTFAVSVLALGGNKPPKSGASGYSRSYRRWGTIKALGLFYHYGATTSTNLRIARYRYM